MIDTEHWFGIPFSDLDVRHWLPYLTAEQIGQAEPKLTRELDFATEWTMQSDPVGEAA